MADSRINSIRRSVGSIVVTLGWASTEARSSSAR